MIIEEIESEQQCLQVLIGSQAMIVLLVLLLWTVTDSVQLYSFNFVWGTQSIGVKYQFTKNDKLIETSNAIFNMGSNILKIPIGAGVKDQYDLPQQNFPNLASQAAGNASIKRVLDMPFTSYFFWTSGLGKN